jgi:hypothetical protein
VCVVTRIEFRSPWLALWALVRFRKLERLARDVDGFVFAHRWLEHWKDLTIISVWRDDESVFRFTGLEEHVNAIRRTIAARASVWSVLFEPRGASSLSNHWLGELEPWIHRERREQQRT